jgi:hypothetical protein
VEHVHIVHRYLAKVQTAAQWLDQPQAQLVAGVVDISRRNVRLAPAVTRSLLPDVITTRCRLEAVFGFQEGVSFKQTLAGWVTSSPIYSDQLACIDGRLPNS